VFVKVCGVTTVDDALAAAESGADAVGLNFIPSSRRHLSLASARTIARALAGRVQRIGVVADASPGELDLLGAECDVDLWQLAGDESPEDVRACLPRAFKAARIGTREDVVRAAGYPGELILVDAKVEGHLGGSGQRFDWGLVTELAAARRLILAGGLTPENVAEAVMRVRPWGVDVATGVEVPGDPRRKDPELLRRFVLAARSAAGRFDPAGC
jgi:phosphoribosylanthranilate isomerase